MGLKVSRLPFFVLLLVLFACRLSANAQAVPCAAITRNPLVLEALLDSHSNDSEPGLKDGTINAAQLEHLQFMPIVIQPGDALYVEYRGRDFTINADFTSGDRTAFDSSPKGSYDQWRKGILPLDMFRAALSQRLIRLRAIAKNPNQVLFRNIKIIRAGKPVFEFAKLASYGKPQVKTAVQRQLPCIGFDEAPGSGSATTASYSLPNAGPLRNFSRGLAQPMLPPFPMMMQSTTPGADANHYKFTGKELDDETGLYNYGARYYGPALGRFITPDWSANPVAIPYADLSNPQTLNLYNFGRSNPLSMRDPDGHDPGDKFKSKTAAAADAVRYIRKQENGYKFEYGTRIEKDGKSYSYKEPVTQGKPGGIDLPPIQKNDVGDVHTHNYGVDDAHANSIEQPDRIGTVQDKDEVQKMQDDSKTSVDYQSYVGAPNGNLLQFTPNPNAPDGLGDARVVQKNVAPDPNPPKAPAQQPQPQPKKEEPK